MINKNRGYFHLIRSQIQLPEARDYTAPKTWADIPDADKTKLMRYVISAKHLRATKDSERRLIQMVFDDGPADQLWMSEKQWINLRSNLAKADDDEDSRVYAVFEIPEDDMPQRYIWSALGEQQAIRLAIRFKAAVPESLLRSDYILTPFELEVPDFVKIVDELIDHDSDND